MGCRPGALVVAPTRELAAQVRNELAWLLEKAGHRVVAVTGGTSIGGELNNLRSFITSLPQGTEVFVGFMQNGRVVPANDMPGFTANHAAAAQSLRLPMGLRGASASPYFCLSDFVKNWPSEAENQSGPRSQQPTHKALTEALWRSQRIAASAVTARRTSKRFMATLRTSAARRRSG